jgi:hypothetical protein
MQTTRQGDATDLDNADRLRSLLGAEAAPESERSTIEVVLVRLLGVAGFVLVVLGFVVLLCVPYLPHSLPASTIVAGMLLVGGAEFLERRRPGFLRR